MIFFQKKKLSENQPHVVVLYLDPQLAKKKTFSLSGLSINWRIASKAFGFGLMVVSFSVLLYLYSPYVFKEVQFRLSQLRRETVRAIKKEPPKKPVIMFADLLGKTKFEDIPEPKDINFGLVIPKIAVNTKVVANVDAGSYREFMNALKGGVAHAAGSALPGQNGTIFIFAHSALYEWDITKFNAVFYQLKDLRVGDEINLFYAGRRYYYKVFDQKIVKPAEVSFLLEDKGEQLVLQTCWPLGTTKERLLIFAKPITAVENNTGNQAATL